MNQCSNLTILFKHFEFDLERKVDVQNNSPVPIWSITYYVVGPLFAVFSARGRLRDKLTPNCHSQQRAVFLLLSRTTVSSSSSFVLTQIKTKGARKRGWKSSTDKQKERCNWWRGAKKPTENPSNRRLRDPEAPRQAKTRLKTSRIDRISSNWR